MGRVKELLLQAEEELEDLWLKQIRIAQHEYEKDKILTPIKNDWKREKI